MSAEPPRCPVCAHAVESVRDEAGWWALPCGHALGRWNFEDIRARLEAAPPLWRFDVPEVPAHVTALRSINESREPDHCVWVRVEDRWALEDRWAQLFPDGYIGTARLSLLALAAYAPLVECEDPRSTP